MDFPDNLSDYLTGHNNELIDLDQERERIQALYQLDLLDTPVSPQFTGSGSKLQFQVIDNGPGVPEEKIPLLFQKYGPDLHPEIRSQSPHTGLGLFICKTIVEAHGGKIWYQPQIEPGACFCFTLPYTSSSLSEIIC